MPHYEETDNSVLVVRYINTEINPKPEKEWEQVIAPVLAREQTRLAEVSRKQEEERIAQEAAVTAVTQPEMTSQHKVIEPVKSAYVASTGALIGSYGYASPFGNCVLEPGVNNPGWGNPIDWAPTRGPPVIGATALFTYNHVGVVTGIWDNGDLEIRHQNFQGGQTRFPRSAFRGFR